jgi:hypothetical protein
MTTEEKTYSVSEVAKKLDRCYMSVWGWIQQGHLSTKKINGRHVIGESEIEKAVNNVKSFRTTIHKKKTASIE